MANSSSNYNIKRAYGLKSMENVKYIPILTIENKVAKGTHYETALLHHVDMAGLKGYLDINYGRPNHQPATKKRPLHTYEVGTQPMDALGNLVPNAAPTKPVRPARPNLAMGNKAERELAVEIYNMDVQEYQLNDGAYNLYMTKYEKDVKEWEENDSWIKVTVFKHVGETIQHMDEFRRCPTANDMFVFTLELLRSNVGSQVETLYNDYMHFSQVSPGGGDVMGISKYSHKRMKMKQALLAQGRPTRDMEDKQYFIKGLMPWVCFNALRDLVMYQPAISYAQTVIMAADMEEVARNMRQHDKRTKPDTNTDTEPDTNKESRPELDRYVEPESDRYSEPDIDKGNHELSMEEWMDEYNPKEFECHMMTSVGNGNFDGTNVNERIM